MKGEGRRLDAGLHNKRPTPEKTDQNSDSAIIHDERDKKAMHNLNVSGLPNSVHNHDRKCLCALMFQYARNVLDCGLAQRREPAQFFQLFRIACCEADQQMVHPVQATFVDPCL